MLKVNLGCGPHAIHGWDNYDLDDHHGVIQRDLSKDGLPYQDNIVSFIYSEHFLEHIERPEALALMKECFRVLRRGGVMRISTPALEVLVDHYTAGEPINLPGVWEPPTVCQMLNGGLHLWGHKFVYDADELWMLLREAGFSPQALRRKEWRKSEIPELADLEVRPWFDELIVEAAR